MHLTGVDWPAPLSPTSAVTSPAWMAKSTSCNTCTAPKLLYSPRSSSSGCWSVPFTVLLPGWRSVMARSARTTRVMQGHSPYRRRLAPRPTLRDPAPRGRCRAAPGGCYRRTRGRTPVAALQASVGAELREVAGAQLVTGDVPVVDHDLDVLLGDRDGLEQHRLDVGAGLRVLHRGAGVWGLTPSQRDGELSRGVGLLLDRLVDGHALVAGEDVLQALHGRVLAGDRDLAVEAVALEHRDRGVAEAVVGGQHAVDVAAGRGKHLLEDRPGLVVVPVRHELVVDLD